MSPLAGPSARSISGSQPGVLDPSQPSRLLRFPTSKLSFASFDPRTAYSDRTNTIPDVGKLSTDDYQRPQRIVIETIPDGTSFWRFIPGARREEGLITQDEGFWPRIVEICGEPIDCTQDQWDIYKLDPEYDCLIQSSPRLSVITKVKFKPKQSPAPPIGPRLGKRVASASLPADSPASKRARQRSITPLSPHSSESEESVNDMLVDKKPLRKRSRSAQPGLGTARERIEENRKIRRENIKKFQAKKDLGVEDDEKMFSPLAGTATKRKVSALYYSTRPIRSPARLREEDTNLHHTSGPFKKQKRSTSPTCSINPLPGVESRRITQEKDKRKRWAQIIQNRKMCMEQELMNGILEDVPEGTLGASNGETFTADLNGTGQNEREDPSDGPWNDEEEEERKIEEARRSTIAESIRKMQELEKDKPLWEEAAQARRRRETAEEDELRAKAERRRRQAQTESESRARAEEERKQAERKEREATAKVNEKRTREKQKERQRWESGPWTTIRALDQYQILCQSFDTTKFSPDNEPLTFDNIPWPVLHAPNTFSAEDIDWAMVEQFFKAVKPYVEDGSEYKTFIEKSHRRFHPDRWRSRRLLTSIVDGAERDRIEVAANTVAQSLTPLWREAKSQ